MRIQLLGNGFADVTIGKHSIEILKSTILTQKVNKITKARSFMEKYDYFILHDLFEKSVACNEAQAHKNQRIQGKNEKLSKP